jgi:hypothetical protein
LEKQDQQQLIWLNIEFPARLTNTGFGKKNPTLEGIGTLHDKIQDIPVVI